jgi:hypothetical protein
MDGAESFAVAIGPRMARTDHGCWVGRKLTAWQPIRRFVILQSDRHILEPLLAWQPEPSPVAKELR